MEEEERATDQPEEEDSVLEEEEDQRATDQPEEEFSALKDCLESKKLQFFSHVQGLFLST